LKKTDETEFTYYKYDSENEKWISTGRSTSNLLSLISANLSMSKPGYICYYRTITKDNLVSALQFPYHIKNYYQPTDT
jgi:hypothetical protein